ncbi:MAG: glycosyltransferase family 2 protein [Brevirhabdus sp.]
MNSTDLDTYLASESLTGAKGPIGMIFVEDLVEVDSTIRHHLDMGFSHLLVFAPPELNLPRDLDEAVVRITYNYTTMSPFEAINAVIEAKPGLWIYYCYNAEYLFFPFCESRNIREMTIFNTEERRDSVLTYVIDLYAGDLNRHQNAVSLADAHMDKSGYYALARPDVENHNHPKERQLDFHGGLRWRFEEHIPVPKRKIDRISIFKAVKGLTLRPDHTFNLEEYNTYACPWHNNLTAAICSFRTAKALKQNPGSTFDIHTFKWHNSTKFEWNSQQLMDFGLMEPGQWF